MQVMVNRLQNPNNSRRQLVLGGIGEGMAREKNGTSRSKQWCSAPRFLATCCLGPMRLARRRYPMALQLRPYHVEVIPFHRTQHLTLTYCFVETRPNQTPSNTPPEPSPYANPIWNAHMGEPFYPQPTPSPTSLHPTDHSRSSQPPHSLPPLSSQCTKPTPTHPVKNQPKVMRRPKGITKNGLKQSMRLHRNDISKHAYNTFKVNVPPHSQCSFADHPLI